MGRSTLVCWNLANSLQPHALLIQKCQFRKEVTYLSFWIKGQILSSILLVFSFFERPFYSRLSNKTPIVHSLRMHLWCPKQTTPCLNFDFQRLCKVIHQEIDLNCEELDLQPKVTLTLSFRTNLAKSRIHWYLIFRFLSNPWLQLFEI